MTKKIIIRVILTFTVFIVLYVFYNSHQQITVKEKLKKYTLSEASLNIYTVPDSSTFYFSSSSRVLLIFFNTECEHCQYEMKELKKNLASFKNTEVVLMSSENIFQIKKFSEEYGLAGQPNVHFTKINADQIYRTLGSLSVPYIFIYGKDRNLLKEFKGETRMEAIIKYLP